MALPDLREFLGAPTEPVPAGEAGVPDEVSAILARGEARTVAAEEKAAAMRSGLERYVAVLRESLPSLTEADLEAAFLQIEEEGAAHRQLFADTLAMLRERRAKVAKLKRSPASVNALQLYDRQIRMLQLAIASFEWGKGQIEALRDVFLVRETQAFSRGFWGED